MHYSAEMVGLLDTKSTVKLGRFRSQLETFYVYNHLEEL